MSRRNYDIIVVGGGHAGIEASIVSAKLGLKSLLITINLDNVGYMSCNPAIGGLSKGQLVKELDALGGEMGRAIDATATQFKTLNRSRGVAVQSSRAQADKRKYNSYMKNLVENQENLYLKQGKVVDLLVENNKVTGVKTDFQGEFYSKAVILSPGTFLNGLIHIGLKNYSGGRMGESASKSLSEKIRKLGFEMGRFKTGTCARLDANTINFDVLKEQTGDKNPSPFSLSSFTSNIDKQEIPCYITYTNKETHKVIRDNLNYSPLYTGVIEGTGVRYCPSIEDKVVKFPHRDRHHVFLEPEGKETVEVYPNGISTSLPIKVQEKMISTIEGLEDAEMIRPGYGIEHDYVQPTQLRHTLETKSLQGLFLAGQINGTTGYEEAAVQGFMAGVNAAHKILHKSSFILPRTQAYIGVLIDDLVTKGVDEPYRMFTSRAEYRLILREDNVDLRLREIGWELGLISLEERNRVRKKKEEVKRLKKELRGCTIHPDEETNKKLEQWGTTSLKHPEKASKLLKRPQVGYRKLWSLFKDGKLNYSQQVKEQVGIQIKYEGYIKRQQKEIDKFHKLERIKIPIDFEYEEIDGLSREIIEKLKKVEPASLGQALRIPGITPTSISILNAALNRRAHRKEKVE